MNDDLEEPGQRRRIPRNTEADAGSESNDATERQPVSSERQPTSSERQPSPTERRDNPQDRSSDRYSNSSRRQPYSSERQPYSSERQPYSSERPDRYRDNSGNRSSEPREYRPRNPDQRNYNSDYRGPQDRSPSQRYNRDDRPDRQDRQGSGQGGYGGRRDYNRQPRPYDKQRYPDRAPRSDDRGYGGGAQRRYNDRGPEQRSTYSDRPRYNERPRGPGGYSSEYRERDGGQYRERNNYRDGGQGYRDRDRDGGGRGSYGGRQDFRGRRTTQQRPTNITKALVRLLFASRGFSLKAIQQGIVSLNGTIVRNPNAAVRLLQDEVRVGDVLMAHNPTGVYVVMNKPKKFAGSRENDSRHVMNLITKKAGWYIPGGPLAKSASGIIILTNDPEQSDPQNNMFALMDKEYWFKVNTVLSKKDLSKLSARIEALNEENTDRVQVDVAQKNARHTWISIVVRKARMHELSKAVAESGMEILAIERRRIGSISVDELPAGSWRRMSEEEMQSVITSSVSRASVEERVEADQEVPTDEPSVWQKLYHRWFKST